MGRTSPRLRVQARLQAAATWDAHGSNATRRTEGPARRVARSAKLDVQLLQAGELGRDGVVADRRARVAADVERLVEREDERHRPLDSALRHLLAVHVERPGAAGARLATVVGELEPDLLVPRADRLLGGDDGLIFVSPVVDERR